MREAMGDIHPDWDEKEPVEYGEGYAFTVDLNTHTWWWTEQAAKQFPLPDGCLQGTAFLEDLLHPNDRSSFLSMLQEKGPLFQGQFRFQLCDGGYAWVACNGRRFQDEGRCLAVGAVYAVRPRGDRDIVTNLPNHYAFRQGLLRLTRGQAPFGVLLLGIDDFKRINDLYSYTLGDEALGMFSKNVLSILPSGAMLYRLDGDNFGVVWLRASRADMEACFHSIQAVAKKPRYIIRHSVSFTVSGGITLYPQDGSDYETLYRNGRLSLTVAKQHGKQQAAVYSQEVAEKNQRTMRLLEGLRESVEQGFTGFSLRYQPLIYAADRSLYGCEALLRWRSEVFPGGVPPEEFVPLLERNGMIAAVGQWVLETALAQCAKWFTRMPSFHMNLNAAAEQFEHPAFHDAVMRVLASNGLPSSVLTLELTESGEIQDSEQVGRSFDFFRSQGIRIAFDDFGTAYASLSIFRMLRADELKIDRSFIERITYDVTDQKLVEHLIELCNSMNMCVCVEGVETAEMEHIIRQLGPRLLQGYYYSAPLAAEEFEAKYFACAPYASSEPPLHPVLRPAQPLPSDMLLDYANAGIFQVNLDENFSFLTCNEGYRRMLGYTTREISGKIGNQALLLVHPDDQAALKQDVARQLGQGDQLRCEFRVVRSDGTPIWVVATGNVVHTRQGSKGLVVVIVDNNAEKRQHLEAVQAQMRYRLMLEYIPTGVICTQYDDLLSIKYLSPPFLKLLGYSREQALDQFHGSYLSLIYETDRPGFLSSLHAQAQAGTQVANRRYRLCCSDNRLIWFETLSRISPPDVNGIRLCYAVTVGVNEQDCNTLQDRGRDFTKRYEAAARKWGDVLFDYDFASRQIFFSDNFSNMFGWAVQEISDPKRQLIHPDDVKKVEAAAFSAIRLRKTTTIEVQLHRKNSSGEYFWCAVLMNEPDFLDDKPVSMVGRITDIDTEKRERDLLLNRSRHDELTGLLNRGALENDIEQALRALSQNDEFAMFMLDIDDFKHFNDNYGHMFGDEVLRCVAKRLSRVFRKTDSVGRAGGDEFMVLVACQSGSCTLDRKAEQLMLEMAKPYQVQGKTFSIGVSVGIARAPTDGTDYDSLFRCADSALYRAKDKGKNTYCLHAK